MAERALLVAAGLGQGLLVSAAIMLYVTILDILPRCALLSGVRLPMNVWGGCFAAGVMIADLGSLFGLTFYLPIWLNGIAFIFFGAYVGVLVMALAETLDLFPACLGKIVPSKAMKAILFLLVVGKIAGSLLYWFFPELWG